MSARSSFKLVCTHNLWLKLSFRIAQSLLRLPMSSTCNHRFVTRKRHMRVDWQRVCVHLKLRDRSNEWVVFITQVKQVNIRYSLTTTLYKTFTYVRPPSIFDQITILNESETRGFPGLAPQCVEILHPINDPLTESVRRTVNVPHQSGSKESQAWWEESPRVRQQPSNHRVADHKSYGSVLFLVTCPRSRCWVSRYGFSSAFPFFTSEQLLNDVTTPDLSLANVLFTSVPIQNGAGGRVVVSIVSRTYYSRWYSANTHTPVCILSH